MEAVAHADESAFANGYNDGRKCESICPQCRAGLLLEAIARIACGAGTGSVRDGWKGKNWDCNRA
jgi:hypothetical protein